MKLPEGIFDRPRQESLIDKDRWAIVRIDTGSGRYPHNSGYKIRDRNFAEAVAPYLHGDWEEFDRYFRFSRERIIQVEGQPKGVESIYSTAEHVHDPKLPNLTVIPNLTTTESRGMAKPLWVFGTNMGHYHPFDFDRIQEVYEFQTYGAMVIDRELGEVELWVARDGDKVAVPSGCHMTLYNLGDLDFPLITLNFSDPKRNPSSKSLISRFGPIMLGYYDDFEVVFALNRTYINNPKNSAGVKLSSPLVADRERKIRISRGARLDLGSLLYEQLTQNPNIIGKFARLGIRIRQASPEAVLGPLSWPRRGRLFFSLPLVTAAKKGTDVYRYFLPDTEPAKPTEALIKPQPQKERPDNSLRQAALDRPMVVLIEGVGDWVEQTYRPLFERKVIEKRKLSVFYADDTRWKKRPEWANQKNRELNSWEVYLDKADPDDFAKYQKLRPDVVFVVTPDFTHSTIAKRWLNKVPLIFLEKPFDSQISNVDGLRRSIGQPNKTEILGLDHYQFYALPIEKLKPTILEHLGNAIASVDFYLTESRPIELNREKALQYGLTLDLLPHLISLLTYFGDIGTIDQICIIEAGQYDPLRSRGRDREGGKIKEKDIRDKFYTETYSRVRFTFIDNSGNGFHVPCFAVVGKGFTHDVKYLQIKGISGNSLRVDLSPRESGSNDRYPWDSVFFIQGPNKSSFANAQVYETVDPYREGQTLQILEDPNQPSRFQQRLERERYSKLIDDLIDGTNGTIISTLSLAEGQNIVRALDRIWWGVQARRQDWVTFELSRGDPFACNHSQAPGPITESSHHVESDHRRILDLSFGDRTATLANDDREESYKHRASDLVRTRGVLIPRSGRSEAENLPNLINLLRREVGDLPLTILIHGWPAGSADGFLQILSPSLEPGDAVWLISTFENVGTGVGFEQPAPSSTLALDGTVSLNLSRKTDRRIYYNLVADLVFFPGLVSAEEKRLSLLRGRSRAIVIDDRGTHSKKILESGRSPRIEICTWRGDEQVAYWHRGPVPIHSRPTQPNAIDLKGIGHVLQGLIKNLTNEYDRRLDFRASLLKLIDTYAGRPTWGMDLIYLANQDAWPVWAVECLPQLFVHVDLLPSARNRVLAWHYIIDCIPALYENDYEITRKLCSETIFEAVMSGEVYEFIQTAADFFQLNLALNPRPSERSLLLAVNKSMMDIEYWIDQHRPEIAEEFDEKRKQFVDKMRHAPT